MKVKLLISRAGAGFAQNAGDVIDVAEDEAKRLIGAGQAQPVRRAKPETATRKPKAEKAAK